MKKCMFIVFYIFIIILAILAVMPNKSLASGVDMANMVKYLDPYDPNPQTAPGVTVANVDATYDSKVIPVVAQIFTVIQYVGTGISIAMVMKLGISYMFSSIEEKAEIKKRAEPIVYGSFLIVAAVNILKFIQNIVTSALTQ